MTCNENLFRFRKNFDYVCRTGRFTFSAPGALLNIDEGEMIACHGNCTERTDSLACPVTKTSISARLITAGEHDRPAILNSLINKFFCRSAPTALTHDPRKNWLPCHGFLARDTGNCLRSSCSRRHTQIRGDLRVFDNCFRVLFASCEPASPSVSMSKDFLDLLDLWISPYRKFFCGKREPESEYGSNSSEEDEGVFD